MKRVRITENLVGAAALALLWAGPAAADVRAGVEAWSRGDYARAVREWKDPAVQGDPDAQFNLAQAYRLGRGVDSDPKQALALYAKAAAQGHVEAADNYGIMLFQDGQREKALPYLQGAAGRGDPRAQYLLGIAHFNGDLVAKDWQRAYALMTLANGQGLPQARAALTQMDEYIPLADRQASQTIATNLRAEAEATRQRQLAAVDLAIRTPAASAATSTPGNGPGSAASAAVTAGADFARPRPVVTAPAATPRVAESAPKPVPTNSAPSGVASAGPWKLQLGAFGVPGNADRLWTQLSGRAELKGKAKVKKSSGALTLLQAGGFATKTEAEGACASLKRAGQGCLVTQ